MSKRTLKVVAPRATHGDFNTRLQPGAPFSKRSEVWHLSPSKIDINSLAMLA